MDAVVGQLGLVTQMAMSAPQGVLGVTAIAAVLCLEVPYRVAGIRVSDIGVMKCAKNTAAVLYRCAPEVLGVSMVLFLALLLRMRGDTEVMATVQEQQIWEQIKVEWPILMGADTLLNLQAMLRLLVLCFVAIRAEWGGRSPMSGMAALLFLAAAITRGTLNTQSLAYRLEGPLSLGGDLPIACEFASVPFFAALGFNGLRRAPVKAVVLVSGGLWFASHHYLNLAKDPSTDRLFLQAHVLEMLAAFAYVVRACSLMVGGGGENSEDARGLKVVEKSEWKGNVFVGFMHVLLTFQQALSAYYFLTAFEPHQSLVGSGRPFCVLTIANLLALGAFLCAAAVWAGGSVDLTGALPVEALIEAVQLDDAEVSTTELQGSEAATELLRAPETTPKAATQSKEVGTTDRQQATTEA